MNKLAFIKASAVRQFVNANGRLVSPQFLRLVDAHVRRKLAAACGVHNGGKKTLDGTVAGHVGITDHPIHTV
jgi:hypothetical protein